MTNGLIRETYTLSNGRTVPKIGFGCYNPKGGDTYGMIRRAIDAGYTYFDTASLYETERAVGQAVKDSGKRREDFIIASKAWQSLSSSLAGAKPSKMVIWFSAALPDPAPARYRCRPDMASASLSSSAGI